MNSDDKQFGLRLKNERKRLKYTQKDFAERAGIKTVTQYLYEAGDNSPNTRYLREIGKLGVNLDYVFFNRQTSSTRICLEPELIKDIYRLVDEISHDEKGKILSIESRVNIFSVLCATHENQEEQVIDKASIKKMLRL